jgi:hypothetical protein
VAHNLGGQQHLEDTNAHQATFVIETGDPVLEKPFRESSFGYEENDALQEVQSDAQECSKVSSWLVGDARTPKVAG